MKNLKDVTLFNFTGVYESEDFYKDIDNPRFIECRNIDGTDCFCDDEGENSIRSLIVHNNVPLNGIHFIDNGNYHYMSYIFTSYIKEDFHLIYLDNHPDMKESMFGDILSCGSWVKKVLDTNTCVRKVIAVGVDQKLFDEISKEDSKKVTLVSEKHIYNGTKACSDISCNGDMADMILQELSDDLPVYISIDKDVLNKDQLMTNWDQGIMDTDTLLHIIQKILSSKRVLGIDVCGEVSLDTECDYDVQIMKNNSFNRKLLELMAF